MHLSRGRIKDVRKQSFLLFCDAQRGALFMLLCVEKSDGPLEDRFCSVSKLLKARGYLRMSVARDLGVGMLA